MSDADLIYNACLRVEKRLESAMEEAISTARYQEALAAYSVVQILREEIGNGLSRETR